MACVISLVATAQLSEKAFEKWHQNKYSMFIHFGLYSELGGVWAVSYTHLNYALLTGFCAGVLQPEYAKVFESCSAEDIARIMKSFALENCQINEPYLELLKRRLGG